MLRTVESLTVIPEKFVSLPKDVGNMTSLQGLLFQETMLFLVLKHPLQILQNAPGEVRQTCAMANAIPGRLLSSPLVGVCQSSFSCLHPLTWSLGDKDYCWDGLQFYCCEIPEAKRTGCRWMGKEYVS
jgi:hypothetical protein